MVKYVKNFEGAGLHGNGIGAILDTSQTFMPVEAIKSLMLSISGQVWYLLAATGLLMFWGIVMCIRQFKNKKYNFFYGFVLLALMGTMGISGIWWTKFSNMDNPGKVRVDGLFYGRYNECILGIFLLLGLLYLIQMNIQKNNICLLLTGSVMMLLTGAILSNRMKNIGEFYVQGCSVFGLEYYRWFGQFNAMICTGIAFVLALVLFFGMGYGVRELKNKDFRIVAICCSCILFWGLIGLQGTRSFTMVEQRFTKQFNELFDYVKDLQADKVYVYGSYKAAADIQTRIMESEVICVNENDIKDIKWGN